MWFDLQLFGTTAPPTMLRPMTTMAMAFVLANAALALVSVLTLILLPRADVRLRVRTTWSLVRDSLSSKYLFFFNLDWAWGLVLITRREVSIFLFVLFIIAGMMVWLYDWWIDERRVSYPGFRCLEFSAVWGLVMTCPSEDKNECSAFQILPVLLRDIAWYHLLSFCLPFGQVMVDDRAEALLGITRKSGCYKVKRISWVRSCIDKVLIAISHPGSPSISPLTPIPSRCHKFQIHSPF